MANQSNEQLISGVKKIMICTGVWRQPISTNTTLNHLYLAYCKLMLIGRIILWFLLTGELVRLVLARYPNHVIIESLAVVITNWRMNLKFIVYEKTKIFQIFEVIVLKEREVWESRDVEKTRKYSKKVNFMQFGVLAMLITDSLTVLLMEGMGKVNH